MITIDDFTHERDEIDVETFGGRTFTVPGKVRYFWRGYEVDRELFTELLSEVLEED